MGDEDPEQSRRRKRRDENETHESIVSTNSSNRSNETFNFDRSNPRSFVGLLDALRSGLMNRSETGDARSRRSDEFCTDLVGLYQKLSPSKAKKGDFITDDSSIALDHLYGYIHEAKTQATDSTRYYTHQGRLNALKWDFRYSIHGAYEKTLDDVIRSYLRWATVKVEQADNFGFLINVSEAFRRIETYANLLEKVGSLLIDPPMSAAEFIDFESKDAFCVCYSYDKRGRLVVWRNFKDAKNLTDEEKISSKQMIRYCMFKMHKGMFDEKALSIGVVLVSNMSEVSFWITWKHDNVVRCIKEFALTAAPFQVKDLIWLDPSTWQVSVYFLMKSIIPLDANRKLHTVSDIMNLIRMLGEKCIISGCLPDTLRTSFEDSSPFS